uniref:Uncharacterized protein n=1 Tax=Plectus sambesii TaxID=2011161 RepID=A0A914VG38_9BILA
MLFYVLLLCASLLDAQRPPSDTLTDGHLNKVFCVTDGQCADDEICEKLCLWTHPNGWFVGCKVLCVKRSHDIPLFLVDQPAPSPNPRNAASTQRSSSATLLRSTTGAPQTTRSNLRPNDSHDNISPANPRSGVSNVNGRPFRFGSEFQLAKEEQDLTRAESGDGPFDDDDPQEVAPIELLKLFDENRVIRQDACPPPKICDVNCGIVINEAGCQDCQCVWKGVSE